MAEVGVFDGAGHVELWDGVFYKMTKYEPHNAIITQLIIALRAVVLKCYQVRQEASCSADPLSLPGPDVTVYRGGPWDHFDGPPPPLAGMELLAEVNYSTPEDYSRRLSKYAQAGVPTYWVVDVDARNVAVFTKPQANIAPARYSESKTFARGEEIEVVLGGQPCGTVRVSDFFPPEPEKS
jgi:Uma2 family endonuclease